MVFLIGRILKSEEFFLVIVQNRASIQRLSSKEENATLRMGKFGTGRIMARSIIPETSALGG